MVGTETNEHSTPGTALPTAHALLEIKAESETMGSTCAILTPMIKAKLRDLSAGQVLEVRVNDPTAREDVVSWCRLSGNELLAMIEEEHQGLRFLVRKKRA